MVLLTIVLTHFHPSRTHIYVCLMAAIFIDTILVTNITVITSNIDKYDLDMSQLLQPTNKISILIIYICCATLQM